MYLTFQKQGLNKIYFSYLEIGQDMNISPKGNNLRQQKEADNNTPFFIAIMLMIITSTAIIIMVLVKFQKRSPKLSDLQSSKDMK